MTSAWNDTKCGEYLDCKFYDNETGEVFFVEEQKKEGEEYADFVNKCEEIAQENFDYPEFLGLYTQEDAELLGFDTY